MSAISIVFPHQLFENNPALIQGQPVFIIEEALFFKQLNFHKQKLVFHRASMKAYSSYLEQQQYNITYIDANSKTADVRHFLQQQANKGTSEIHYVNVTDNWLQKRIAKQCVRLNLKVVQHDSPMFLLSGKQVEEYFKKKKHFFQTHFYTLQRKHFRILVDRDNEPIGAKWSFDTENRLKYPKSKRPPRVTFPKPNEYWLEAKRYVEKNFTSSYGEINDAFIYPTTLKESRSWLKQFFEKRFVEFGPYEDALVSEEHILHHSVLTPILNVGLLTPREILDEALVFGEENNIPMNSLEGFIRQILGWREFMRGVYETNGVYERTRNYWKFNRKIPESFWNGSTGIEPVDQTIRKVLATGYCHHIERLMVLGNFMLLCEFDPDEVYKWFMELFIDAYDWVMVPNVYGMSQFADGGLLSTKPYISGSNYLMKMGNYKKGEWQSIWDGLFWRFMHTHREFFLKNPRLSMLIKTFDRMPAEKRNNHLHTADNFLKTLNDGSYKRSERESVFT